MAFISKNSSIDAGTASTLTVQLTSVVAGHLIVVGVKFVGTATTSSVGDGTSTLTELAAAAASNIAGTTVYLRTFYLLASVASGTVTYTLTLGAARDVLEMFAFAHSYTGTAAADQGNANGNTSGNMTSGNITTTDNTVSFGLHGYAGFAITGTPTINAVSADQVQTNAARSSMWSREVTGTYTGGAAATLSGSDHWAGSIAAIKITAAAGGHPTIRRWGGVPFVGGLGVNGASGSGRMWGRVRSGLSIPRWLADQQKAA